MSLAVYGAELKKWASQYTKFAMARMRTLDVWEIGLFKICLFSLGAWFATTFSNTMKKFKHLFLIAFLGSWIYFIWRIFLYTEE